MSPFKQTSALATAAARLYAPIARTRVKNLLYHWPLEVKAAKKLGFYGYTD